MANKKLKNSLKKFSGQKEEKLVTITGELGIPLGGQKIVEVPNRNGFVYVRLKSNTSEVIQAYNSEVSTIYGLPVLVARQGNIYKVIGRNLNRYQDWSDIPYLPKHGGQHSFNFGLGMGADVSWIYSQQFMPLLSYPSGTQGSMTLSLEPHFYEWEGQWRYAQNTGTPSYTPYLPTITGSARMVLSYLDPSDNSIKLVPGTPFSNSLTGSAQVAPYIPDIPRSAGIPLAAVRLVTGTTAIGWGNIYDMRDFYTVSPRITGSTFSGIAVQDEGIPLGTGTVFNFVGANIDATISGSVIRIFVTGSAAGSANPPITGSVVYQDDYSTIGSALVFNFRNGITASASGTNAQIDTDFGSGTNQVPRGNHNHTYSVPLMAHGVGGTIPASTTQCLTPFVTGLQSGLNNAYQRAGTAKNLSLGLRSAQPASGSLVVTLMIGGVATAITITIPAGSGVGTYSDLVHSVAVAAGNNLRWNIQNNATGTSAQIGGISMEIEHTTTFIYP